MEKITHKYVRKQHSIAFSIQINGEEYGHYIDFATFKHPFRKLRRLLMIKHELIKEQRAVGEIGKHTRF